VIVTSEIRKVDRTELTANDLRGAARLGSTPSNIILLWPTVNTNQIGNVVPRTLKIAKSRNGDEGFLQVQFHHKICKFTETSEGEQPGSSRCNTGENERSARLDPANDL
jgi:hypothetical protein